MGVFIFALLAFIGLVLYDAFSWGLVCWKFWMWFILPMFPTLPVIVYMQAVGLMFFIDLFKNKNVQLVKQEYTEVTLGMVMQMISPWLVLLVGLIFKGLIR